MRTVIYTQNNQFALWHSIALDNVEVLGKRNIFRIDQWFYFYNAGYTPMEAARKA
jgi:hypothetical protein